MGLVWSTSWGMDLIFCTHAKKNVTFNLSQFGGQIQQILFLYDFRKLENRKTHKKIQNC